MQKQIRFYGRLDSYPPYDTFDNLANRTGAYYYGSYSSDTGTYQNSRRQDWTYDADGQVTQSPTSSTGATTFRDWQYDAAGKMIKAIDTSTSSGTTTTKTYTSSYDGDGKLISELTSSQGLSYVVRSSVTGKVVTRVGATQKNIVSVDGLLTTVLTDGPPATIQWVHTDPHGLSEVTNTSGQQRAVYDPLENYIPNQPWPGPSGLSFPGGQSPSSGLGSNFGFTGTSSNVACTLEGLPYDCNKAFHMIATGSAEQCPNNYCGPERVINPWTRQVELRPLTRDPETGQLGYFPTKPKPPKGSNPQDPGQAQNKGGGKTKESDECKGIRAHLLGDSRNKNALNDAWKRTQAGTVSAHEEGGLLGTVIDEGQPWQKDRLLDQRFAGHAGSPAGALDGFTFWAQHMIRHDAGVVSYDYWYHTHPFELNDQDPINPQIFYGDPNFPSKKDKSVSSEYPFGVGLRGVIVSSTNIIVFDSSGAILCNFKR